MGGAEHAVTHLLYARFWTRVLYDEGLLGFEEPFRVLRNQGSMLAWTPGRRPRSGEEGAQDSDDGGERVIDWIVLKPEEREGFPEDQIVWRWARMSKSKGNVVRPDDVVEQHGADSLRLYEMFVAPFEDNVQWSEEGLNGAFRFISRFWRWAMLVLPDFRSGWREELASVSAEGSERAVRRKLHQTIRKVDEDIAGFRFNTAVAALMEALNELYAYRPVEGASGADPVVLSEAVETMVLLMAPIAPHLADELWQRMGRAGTTYRSAWPSFDPTVAAEDEITIVIQINGKLRDRLNVPVDLPEEEVKARALASPKVVDAATGKTIRNVVYVRGRLVNVVVG
jgi:leucyl-tRNA synthetase